MGDYTVVRLDDVPDPLGDGPGEMRFLASQLGSEQVTITYRAIAPGTGHFAGDRTTGHRHRTQDEIYFLVSGRLAGKLDDEVIELGPSTALRVGPGVTRTFRNDADEDAVLLIASTRAADLREETELVPDFWPE